MDFVEIFRKVETCANLERDIFGFLKKEFFDRILAKKGQKMSQKLDFQLFSKKSYFLPIFENMHVLGVLGKTFFCCWPKWIKTGPKAGH